MELYAKKGMVIDMSRGRYGLYGGQYISETLMNEIIHLEEYYNFCKKDMAFNEELNQLLK